MISQNSYILSEWRYMFRISRTIWCIQNWNL